MADITYESGPAGYSLTTRAPQAVAVGMPSMGGLPGMGGGPNMDFFARLAQRRIAQEQALRQAEERRRQEAHEMQLRNAGDEANRAAQQGDAQRDAFRDAQERTQYQDQLARNGQPLRMVGGAGIVPGYMPDTNAMNGYQREMFLPKHSAFEAGGLSPTEIGTLKFGPPKPYDPLAGSRERQA